MLKTMLVLFSISMLGEVSERIDVKAAFSHVMPSYSEEEARQIKQTVKLLKETAHTNGTQDAHLHQLIDKVETLNDRLIPPEQKNAEENPPRPF